MDILYRNPVRTPAIHTNQSSTIQGLEKMVYTYGIPKEIQSDQGSHFAGHSVQEWAKDLRILWTPHVPYHPQANGLIEQMNGLLKEQICKLTPTQTLKG